MKHFLKNKTTVLSIISFTAAIFLFNKNIYAQAAGNDESMNEYTKLAGAVVFILVALLFILFFILSAPKYEYSAEKKKQGQSFIAKLFNLLNRSVPIEKEKDIMLDHDFDGIKELDNSIPPWFNLLFYGTIVIAAIYMINYHVIGSGNIMIDEYVNEIKIANDKREQLIKTGAFINENNVTLLTDAAELDKGKDIFVKNCTPCHGPDGGGTVGPNLTDQYWIHGGGIKNLFTVIKNGVPAKGMISWQTTLTPKQIQEVASYIISLQGTKPAVVKPPEGNIWIDTVRTTGNDSLKVNDSVKVKADSIKVKQDTVKLKNDTAKVKKDSLKTK